MSDSAYLWSKPLKSEFYFSGLPEKACQGCHISKWVPRNFAICTSNWRILDPWLIAIVGFHGTKIWFVQNCACATSVKISICCESRHEISTSRPTCKFSTCCLKFCNFFFLLKCMLNTPTRFKEKTQYRVAQLHRAVSESGVVSENAKFVKQTGDVWPFVWQLFGQTCFDFYSLFWYFIKQSTLAEQFHFCQIYTLSAIVSRCPSRLSQARITPSSNARFS